MGGRLMAGGRSKWAGAFLRVRLSVQRTIAHRSAEHEVVDSGRDPQRVSTSVLGIQMYEHLPLLDQRRHLQV